jgi:hypothetical protein
MGECDVVKPRTRTKTFVHATVLACAAWGVIELGAYSAYRIQYGEYSKSALKADLRKLTAVPDEADAVQGGSDLWWGGNVCEVLHPYFGFVLDPARNSGVSEEGFLLGTTGSVMRTRAPDRLVVGVFGGSFAQQLFWESSEVLRQCLGKPGVRVEELKLSGRAWRREGHARRALP